MAIRNDLVSSIEREQKVCDLAVQELINRCSIYEEQYNLSSHNFYLLFKEGKMGDEEDYFEWKYLIEGIKEWQQTKKGLLELKV